MIGTTANENGPADNDTLEPPEPVRAAAVAAARAFGLRLAAVELRGDDGVIVEVNGTPGLHYHAQVADPSTAVDVATPILETLLDREPN
jgi:D-alanine-D-alanine ligase-like ATP-grasp enzyme